MEGGIDIRLFGSFNRIATFNNSRKLLRNNQRLYEVLHRSDITERVIVTMRRHSLMFHLVVDSFSLMFHFGR